MLLNYYKYLGFNVYSFWFKSVKFIGDGAYSFIRVIDYFCLFEFCLFDFDIIDGDDAWGVALVGLESTEIERRVSKSM